MVKSSKIMVLGLLALLAACAHATLSQNETPSNGQTWSTAASPGALAMAQAQCKAPEVVRIQSADGPADTMRLACVLPAPKSQ